MTCGNCARHVAEAIQSVAGVRSATVHLEQNRASVRWGAGAGANPAAVIQAVVAAGFEASVLEPSCAGENHTETKLAGWQLTLWIGVLGTLPLMLGEWVFGLGMTPWFQWVSFGLAAVVQIGAGARFYRGAWSQIKVGNSNMDALVSLGSTTAFGYSAWALLSGQGGHLYFMEAAAIITLISLGHWVESRVSSRTSSALRQLLDLAPARARRRSADGAEVEVPVAELKIGDQVVLRPGDRIPTDGEVVDGSSAVDESMLTGEATPVDKGAASPLYGGTTVSNGRLLMRVTAIGEETALAHIVAAVQRAQNSRANIQRLGDRVSSVFVPIVVAVAVATGLWWGLAPAAARHFHEWLAQGMWSSHIPDGNLAAALLGAAAVLIIACPCAMGLATPAAIMAGANAAAQRGILIRDGVALEKAGQVTAVLFDKTGTLTLGKPVVAANWYAGGTATGAPPGGGPPPLFLAITLARHSTHPISQAVARLGPQDVAASDWQEVRGCGVQARVRESGGTDRIARLGSLNWLAESSVALNPAKAFIDEASATGATLVGVSFDQQLVAVFAVQDEVKPGAREVVQKLHNQGLRTYLVTGDRAAAARSVAQQTGIDPQNIFSEVRPERKAEFVRQLQARGERVAFVGDGINDAPALEQADLGIAVSRASDIAREAADIILLKSEIEAVPESLGLARATLRTIKQNLFWAFAYNSLGIPLAALGFLSPILCAAAMGLSDLVVIGNALRLRRWKA
jgi:Cu+-exporting ATPase